MGNTSNDEARRGARKGLTDADCRNAKPAARPYKLGDSLGLFLLVKPNGAKLWRLKYRHAGREKLLAIGAYTSARAGAVDVTLREARERRDEARNLLRDSIDPSAAKRDRAAEAKRSADNTFGAVAAEWVAKNADAWAPATTERARGYLAGIAPKIGARPVDQISAAELFAALAPIEKRGALETLHKTRALASQVFDYAARTRGLLGNPAASLKGALKRREQQRYRFLSRADLGPFLVKLGEYSGRPTAIALRLQLLCATRPGELRAARWHEFDLAAKGGPIWRIPAGRMKSRREHVVPLPRQAVELLRELAGLVGSEPGALLFRSSRSSEQPISENTLAFAIRRLGFGATAHGARHTFSTIANEEHLARPETIERALAHATPGVAGRYNTADYLAERRALMQRWADMLDSIEGAATGSSLRAPAQPIKRVTQQPRRQAAS
jgi:integrase